MSEISANKINNLLILRRRSVSRLPLASANRLSLENCCVWMIVSPVEPIIFQRVDRSQTRTGAFSFNRAAGEIPFTARFGIYKAIGYLVVFRSRRLPWQAGLKSPYRFTIGAEYQQNRFRS